MNNSYYLLGAYYEPYGQNALRAQSEDRLSKVEEEGGRGLHWGSARGALTHSLLPFPSSNLMSPESGVNGPGSPSLEFGKSCGLIHVDKSA